MWIVWALALAWGSKAEQLMYAGDVAGALELAKAEAETAPENVAAQERYIDLLLNLYLVDEAVKRARKAVEQRPTDPDAHYLLGRALPDVAQARRAYENALKLEPLHARSHMGMGALHTAAGDPSRAAAAYGRAVRIDSGLSEAWLGLIRSHISAEHLEDALAVSHKAIEALPEHPDGYLTAAVLDEARAVELLETAAKKAGHDARVHAALADRYLERGKGAAALAAAQRALAINAADPVALRVQLFARELKKGTLDAAGYQALLAARKTNGVPEHDALVARYRKSPAVLIARSRAHRAVGDDSAALADLASARGLAPNEPEILGQLGLLLIDLKRPAEAVAPLARAREGRPWDNSLTVAWAKALSLSDQHQPALEAYRELIRRSPYDTQLTIAYADALLRAGKPEAAYQTVLAAAEKRMDDQLVVALMATAAQAGRFTEAADIMQQIADRTGDPRAAQLARELRSRAQK